MSGNKKRSVDIPPKLVVAERGCLPADVSTADRSIALPLVGIERGITEIFVGCAVEIASTALGDNANLARRGAAILGAVIGRENLHFLDSIHIGCANARSVRTRADADSAVVRDEIVLRAAAIDVEPAGR